MLVKIKLMNKSAEKIKAGDAWLNYIKQFENLDQMFNSLPEAVCLLFAQQIDIFAGRYPASHATKANTNVEAMRVLESLTPGGSEYFNDPEACMAIIKHNRDSQHNLIVELTMKIKSLQPTPKVEVETLAEKIFPFEDYATNPSCNHEYIISKMVEMYHKGATRSTPQDNSGLRWVNARKPENRPDKGKEVIVRSLLNGKAKQTKDMGHFNGWDVSLDNNFLWKNTEWLDESGKEVPRVAVECYVPCGNDGEPEFKLQRFSKTVGWIDTDQEVKKTTLYTTK
jgi:hypothetical protein